MCVSSYSTFVDLNGGVYALNSQSLKIRYNHFENVARKGKQDQSRGQFVQFNAVSGAGNEISFNTGMKKEEAG